MANTRVRNRSQQINSELPRGAQKLKRPKGWPRLGKAAYQGLAGDVVKTIAPHSEACEPLLLVSFLIMFGNCVGRGPHFMVESTRHGANESGLFVGPTGSGRKGTGQDRVEGIFRGSASSAITGWMPRIKGGLSSGEGIINQVRDLTDGEAEREEVDTPDKRLMLVEREFASVLAVMQRPGNTLSHVVRNAWDGKRLETMTKSPLTAEDAHVSMIGHVTLDELRRRLDRTELANGFINRFLIVPVYQAQVLPFGGNPDKGALAALSKRLRAAHKVAWEGGESQLSDEAEDLWEEVYSELGGRPGMLGEVTNRAAAHVRRLAMIYALLDKTFLVEVVHLEAALAVWEYCEEGAEIVFGNMLGDPTADTIMSALRKNELSRTEIRDLFGRNKESYHIDQALDLIEQNGLAKQKSVTTKGRPREVWVLT